MKKRVGTGITLLVALIFVLINLPASPAWADAGDVAIGDVAINEANFPDKNFRTFVSEKFDKNHDGILSRGELNRVGGIDVSGKEIATLKGIEHFKALQTLDCRKNQITNLDVSHNPQLEELDCAENQMWALDVSENPALSRLYCGENHLTDLVLNNPELTTLFCNMNQLKTLDLSGSPKLETLGCYSNKIAALDVSRNAALKEILCDRNKLTSLDVTNNSALEELECTENELTELIVGNNPALNKIKCEKNRLTNLDLKSNASITEFDGTDQEYDISVGGSSLTYDLKLLPGSFDGTKTSGWVGGSVSGDTLTLDTTKPDKVTYEYEAMVGKKLSVTLNVNYGELASVTFDANGGDGIMKDMSLVKGSIFTLPDCTFTAPSDKEFKAWEVGGTEKAVGDSMTLLGDTTVKALWKDQIPGPAEIVTITFDKNGGTGNMASVTKNKDELYELPACDFTAPEGKAFKGWEVDGRAYAAGKEVTIKGDTTVKAIWAEPSKPNEGASTGTVTKPQEPEKPDEEKPAVVGSSAAYLTGYPDGSIRPNGFVTRAESAKIIASLKGLDLSAGGQPAFKDLASSWYTPYINAVVNQGLMRGYMDGTFKPNAPITRAEFAQMIMPLDKATEARSPFTDVKGHWAEKAINQAYGNGRIKGYPDGTFRPDGQITRAEAVTICNNFFNRKADKAGLEAALKNPGKIKTFTDLDKSHWAYYEILEAANPHDDQNKA
ncbi:MAG: S-layer homology domain-containing protein [Clostridiales bacterium]|nr:S-layer homology domain-containing protein [Clostridiales bacterium]